MRQMRGELQALRFAAGKRGGGLAQAQIAEADFIEDSAACEMHLGNAGEKCRASRTVSCSTS